MKIKMTSIFFIWQGASMLINSVTNILNNTLLKHWNYVLPGWFNYISVITGLISLICGVGILVDKKFFYKLSLGFSIIFLSYIIVNIFLYILLNDIHMIYIMFHILYIIIYLFIIKSIRHDIQSFT